MKPCYASIVAASAVCAALLCVHGVTPGPTVERRPNKEDTYTITTVVQLAPPFNVADMNDDFQEVRVIEQTTNCLTAEITYYPFYQPTIHENPHWRADYAGMTQYLKPSPTENWDEAMRRDLLKELHGVGIFPERMTDKHLVEKVAYWALNRSSMTGRHPIWSVYYPGGIPTFYPPLQNEDVKERAKEAAGFRHMLEHEVLGREMYYNKTHAACSSVTVYLATILKALGIPTRILEFVPLYDPADEYQGQLFVNNIHHRQLRQTFSDNVERERGHALVADHMLNEVFVGRRWVRLNYYSLGKPILMTHTFTGADMSQIPLAQTFGLRSKKYPDIEPVFASRNVCRLISVQDHFGTNAHLVNPPAMIGDLQAISSSNDVIHLLNGQDIHGAVTGYSALAFDVEPVDGLPRRQPFNTVKSITFRPRYVVFESSNRITNDGTLLSFEAGNFLLVSASTGKAGRIPIASVANATLGGSLKKNLLIHSGDLLTSSIFAPGKVSLVFFCPNGRLFAPDGVNWLQSYDTRLKQLLKEDNDVVLRAFDGAKFDDPVGKQFNLKRWPSILVFDRQGNFSGIVSGEDFGECLVYIKRAKKAAAAAPTIGNELRKVTVLGLYRHDAPEIPKALAQSLVDKKWTDDFFITIKDWIPQRNNTQLLNTFLSHTLSKTLLLVAPSHPTVRAKLSGVTRCPETYNASILGAKIWPEDMRKLVSGVAYSLKSSDAQATYGWIVPHDADPIVFKDASALPSKKDSVGASIQVLPMGIVPPSNINDLQSVSASADVIRLTSGRDIRGAVVRYAESVFEIEQDDGSSLHQAADAIKDITFRPRAAVFEKPDEQDTTSGKITVYVNGSFVVNRSAEVSAIIPAKDISIATFGGSLKKLMTIRGGAPLATSIFAPGKVTMVFFFADWSEWCRGYSSQLEQFVKDDKEVVLRKFTGASHLDPVGKQFKLQRWPSALVYDRNGQFTGIVSGEDFGMFSNFVMQAKQVSGITVPPDSVVQHIKVAGLFHCDAPEVPKAQAQTLEKMKGTDEFLIGIEAGSPGQDLQGLSTFAAHARSGELCLVPASGPNVGIKLNGLVVCASNGTFHAFGAKVLPEDRHKLAFGVTYSLKPSATHTPYDWLVPPDAKRIVFSATSASPAPIDLPLHPSQVAGTDSPLPPGIVLPTNSYELQAISDSMDVIRLTTGREFKGAVVRYADTGFEIELDDGSTLKQARDTIQTIAFRPRAAIFENRNTPEAAGGQVVAYANGNFVVNTPEEARVNVSATSVAGASFGGSLKKIMTIHGGAALNTSIFAPGKVTMVFFYADWSEWCRSYKIKLEQLIKENNDVVLRIFDDAKPKDPAFIQFQRLRHWPSVCVYDRFGRFSGEVSGQDFSLFLGFVHKIQKATLPIASQDL